MTKQHNIFGFKALFTIIAFAAIWQSSIAKEISPVISGYDVVS